MGDAEDLTTVIVYVFGDLDFESVTGPRRNHTSIVRVIDPVICDQRARTHRPRRTDPERSIVGICPDEARRGHINPVL